MCRNGQIESVVVNPVQGCHLPFWQIAGADGRMQRPLSKVVVGF